MNIVYLLTDTITNRKYIGSKKDWKGTGTYFGTLRCKEKHPKYKLQQEWKKASKTRPETFQMKILEEFDTYGQHVVDAE